MPSSQKKDEKALQGSFIYFFFYPESIQLILFTLKFEISIKSLFTSNFFIINILYLLKYQNTPYLFQK